MITTSKLNNSIVFSLAIFWGARVDKMGAEGQGPRAKGRGTQTLIIIYLIVFSINDISFYVILSIIVRSISFGI